MKTGGARLDVNAGANTVPVRRSLSVHQGWNVGTARNVSMVSGFTQSVLGFLHFLVLVSTCIENLKPVSLTMYWPEVTVLG